MQILAKERYIHKHLQNTPHISDFFILSETVYYEFSHCCTTDGNNIQKGIIVRKRNFYWSVHILWGQRVFGDTWFSKVEWITYWVDNMMSGWHRVDNIMRQNARRYISRWLSIQWRRDSDLLGERDLNEAIRNRHFGDNCQQKLMCRRHLHVDGSSSPDPPGVINLSTPVHSFW